MFNFINNRYGSKKGFWRYVHYQILFRLGMFKAYEEIDFTNVRRFVFVCNGNICRSALAEVVMKKCGGNACSFGLDTRGGDLADPRMVANSKEYGIDLSEHLTSRIDQYSTVSGDLLVGMEPVHCQKLRLLYPNNQITCLGIWSKCKKVYIHDPYSANNAYFRNCAKDIAQTSHNLYTKWLLESTATRK